MEGEVILLIVSCLFFIAGLAGAYSAIQSDRLLDKERDRRKLAERRAESVPAMMQRNRDLELALMQARSKSSCGASELERQRDELVEENERLRRRVDAARELLRKVRGEDGDMQ